MGERSKTTGGSTTPKKGPSLVVEHYWLALDGQTGTQKLLVLCKSDIHGKREYFILEETLSFVPANKNRTAADLASDIINKAGYNIIDHWDPKYV